MGNTETTKGALRQRLGLAKRRTYARYKAMRSGMASIGADPEMQGRLNFRFDGRAAFGDNFKADGRDATISLSVRPGASLTVGNRVSINYGVAIEVWHDVQIGDNVKLAPYVSILDDNRHDIEPGSVRYKGPVIIGRNAWLGRGVIVMPGVRIGACSVIGANSVVTRDIPPNSFAAGMPAKVIRTLEVPDGWVRS